MNMRSTTLPIGTRVYDGDHGEFGRITGYVELTNNYTVELESGRDVYVHPDWIGEIGGAE